MTAPTAPVVGDALSDPSTSGGGDDESPPQPEARGATATLAVSKTGNGVGVAIVRLAPRTDSDVGDRVAIFHVLPKVWRPTVFVQPTGADAQAIDDGEESAEAAVGARNVDLVPILTADPRESVHVTVFEGDDVTVPADIGRRLRDAVQTDVGKKASDGQKLFAPGVPGARTRVSYRDHGGLGPVAALWQLVGSHLREDLVKAFDDIELLGTIAQHIPSLEHAIRRAFLASVEDALRIRRSNFVSFTEETLFVRGRMEPRSLIDRRVKQRLPVTCTFDDLSHDTPLWQAVRAAVRVTASDADPLIGSDAARVDSRLADVSMVGVPAALNLLSVARQSKEARRLRKLVNLTRAVLLFQYPAGGVESVPESHAVTLKVTTADLWEKLLAQLLDQEPTLALAPAEDVRLFDRSEHEKQPDLVRIAGDRTVVVDAKYKRQGTRPTMSSLSMSDQYQCYAYANLLNATTAFVTVRTDGPGSDLFMPDRIRLGRGDQSEAPAVAVIPVPFPEAGDAADGAVGWAEREHHRLTGWLMDPAAYEQ